MGSICITTKMHNHYRVLVQDLAPWAVSGVNNPPPPVNQPYPATKRATVCGTMVNVSRCSHNGTLQMAWSMILLHMLRSVMYVHMIIQIKINDCTHGRGPIATFHDRYLCKDCDRIHQLYNTIPQLTCVCNITHSLVVECKLNCGGQQKEKALIPSHWVEFLQKYNCELRKVVLLVQSKSPVHTPGVVQ